VNQDSERHILAAGRFVRLVCESGWEWAERTNSSGVVAVVAVTDAGQLVLTEQFRPPLAARVLDLPAGLSGDVPGAEDEALLVAARRELLEETGYESARWQWLTEGPTSAGLTNEVLTFFLAAQAKRVADGGGDASEEIDVHVVPLAEAETWLEEKRTAGVLIDPKIYAGLYFGRRAK